jgi:hypothetical protein
MKRRNSPVTLVNDRLDGANSPPSLTGVGRWRHSFVGCGSGLGGLNTLVRARTTVCQSIHVLNRIGRVVAATLDILRGRRRR